MTNFIGAMFIFSLALVGCSDKGKLFVWNGSDQPLMVTFVDQALDDLALRPQSGHLFERVSVGSYAYTTSRADGTQAQENIEVVQKRISIANLSQAACFARVDIAGMYTPGKERIVFLESYDNRPVLTLDDMLHVFPGEPVPPTRPKSSYAFQRMQQIPCDVVDDRISVTEYLRTQK